MADLSPLFVLADSAVVQAGAGTGKTHSLITLCLNLLAGAGRAEPLSPQRLCAVTFTEKAAAELSARLRQRVDRLAELSPGAPFASETALREHEPELCVSCGAAGQPLPPASVWRRVRRDLGLAQIGTLHALCGQVLRRHAAAAGLDPAFTQLDELEARALARESCEAAALEALEGGPLEPAARRLSAELGFKGGRFTRGLAEELVSLLRALGESGRDAAALVASTPGLSEPLAVAEDGRARSALLAAIDALEAGARAPGKRSDSAAQALDLCATFRSRLWPQIGSAPTGELRLALRALRELDARLAPKGPGSRSDAMKALRDAYRATLEADAQVRACRLAGDLAALADAAIERYRAAKARSGGLDFDDLTRRARDLLAKDPSVRRVEKARIGALLVDEFQDTSRPQLELLGWLAEGTSGEGKAPAGSGQPGALPVARGLFVAVGDRKQSIYEFRGADVAFAQAFARAALADGARRYLLVDSRRSRPSLVSFCNLLFARVLAQADRPFDTPFVAGEDDLAAHRPPGPAGPCAELIEVDGGVDDEADAVGRRIAQLLAESAPERVFERQSDGEERERLVRGGDIAILLRASTHVEAFRRALLGRRIPHLVLKGRGFQESREILDLVALLSLALDPDDALSLAAVLRSPVGPVSDDGLVLLSRGPRRGAAGEERVARGLDRRALADPLALAALAPDDRTAVARISRILAHLQHEADRLGPAALLEAALAESDYVAAASGGLFGEQAAANVDKLLSLARAHELRGGDLRGFLERIRALEDGAGAESADAPVVEERDPHAVRILTVHAAKGLEFPVVIVPECAQTPRSPGEGVLVDHDLGLALRVRGADGARRWGPHGERVLQRKKDREEAQARRLLYVAATRARDLLVFSSRPAPSRAETWRGLLEPALGLPEAKDLIRRMPAGALTAPPPPLARAALSSEEELAGLAAEPAGPARAQAREVVARALGDAAAAPAQGTLIAPVTQLADAVACPQRYHLLHEAGLEERPGARELPAALHDPDDEAARPATERGTLAHRLLELVPLHLGDSAARREALRALLVAEGEDPQAQAAVVDACAAFLGSPLGQRMARAAGQRLRLHREHPFALHLAPEPANPPGPALVLRGQLDALLLDDGAATVVDYKHAEKRDPERYAAQLDAYALAARTLLGDAIPVRTGLVFLRSPGAPFVERPTATEEDLARTRSELLGAAAAVAQGRRTGAWRRVAPSRCRQLGCGFLARCHPQEVRGKAG